MVFFASRKLGNMIFRLPLQSLQLVAHRRPPPHRPPPPLPRWQKAATNAACHDDKVLM